MLSNSRSPTICLRPAPSAARTDNSCRRPSTRTSSRFAALAQAISSTRPIDPISTHNTFPMSPTTSCFSGRRFGVNCASSKSCTVNPGGAGKLRFTIGIMRVMSALACPMVTPGRNRATPS